MEDILFSVGDYTCPTNYTQVTRTKGQYCLKVVANAGINVYAAESACQLENSTLASIENSDERSLIFELSKAATTSLGYVWIGATRLGACYGPNYASTTACLPLATSSFRWTDGFVTGTDGFVWNSAPDNTGSIENCVGLSTGVTTGITAAPGFLDTVSCTVTTAVSYVCGQPATIETCNCTST